MFPELQICDTRKTRILVIVKLEMTVDAPEVSVKLEGMSFVGISVVVDDPFCMIVMLASVGDEVISCPKSWVIDKQISKKNRMSFAMI
jgi:hypothetical protein